MRKEAKGMNVASKDLCEELYRLSGWALSPWAYDADGDIDLWANALAMSPDKMIPAYDLGYLLRKLPTPIYDEDKGQFDFMLAKVSNKRYTAYYIDEENYIYGMGNLFKAGEKPENAACKLAIELFKQGVLKNES